MSCYLIDDETISALVVYTLRQRHFEFGAVYNAAGFDISKLDGYDRAPWAQVAEVAQLLLDTNLASVNRRYSESAPTRAIWLDKSTFKAPKLAAVHVLRFCAVYEYQACEAPDWVTSKAREVIDMIRNMAIRNLNGYEDAPASMHILKDMARSA